jgi:hypothetical protein
METTIPAIIYTISIAIVVIFQGCLAIGLPWGAASMGGKYPGKYPPKMRIIAVVNMIVLSCLAIIVLVKSDLLLPQLLSFSNYAIWIVVLFGLISVILNTITKSRIERIWVPIVIIQFVTSIIVALN